MVEIILMCLVAHRSRGSPYFALAITLSLHWNQGRTPGYPPASRIGRVGVLPPHTLGGFGGSEKRPPERYDAHCQGSGGGSLVPGVMTLSPQAIEAIEAIEALWGRRHRHSEWETGP